jgi:hypothetical protein
MTTQLNEKVEEDCGLCWGDLYKTAMLELDPSIVSKRVAAARAAIDRCQAELAKNHTCTLDQLWEMNEALASLEYWKEFNARQSRVGMAAPILELSL